MDWQPIETAPNGEMVILYFPASPSGKNYLPAMVDVNTWPISWPRKPTHWMPLPEPPK